VIRDSREKKSRSTNMEANSSKRPSWAIWSRHSATRLPDGQRVVIARARRGSCSPLLRSTVFAGPKVLQPGLPAINPTRHCPSSLGHDRHLSRLPLKTKTQVLALRVSLAFLLMVVASSRLGVDVPVPDILKGTLVPFMWPLRHRGGTPGHCCGPASCTWPRTVRSGSGR